MPAVTIDVANEMLALYLEAEKSILTNQSYTIKNRTFTRANLSEVVTERKKWQQYIDQINGTGGIRIVPVTPNW